MDWMASLRLPAYRDMCSFLCQSKAKAPNPLFCLWLGRKRWQTYLGGPLHSPHNPVTWIYDAVICGNASPIVGLLKVPEKRWKLSLATCETRAPQAVRWGLLRIWKVCLCSMETEWTLWVLYVDQAVYKGSGTSRPPARLYSTLTLFGVLSLFTKRVLKTTKVDPKSGTIKYFLFVVVCVVQLQVQLVSLFSINRTFLFTRGVEYSSEMCWPS